MAPCQVGPFLVVPCLEGPYQEGPSQEDPFHEVAFHGVAFRRGEAFQASSSLVTLRLVSCTLLLLKMEHGFLSSGLSNVSLKLPENTRTTRFFSSPSRRNNF